MDRVGQCGSEKGVTLHFVGALPLPLVREVREHKKSGNDATRVKGAQIFRLPNWIQPPRSQGGSHRGLLDPVQEALLMRDEKSGDEHVSPGPLDLMNAEKDYTHNF